jgi:hypothetical protein
VNDSTTDKVFKYTTSGVLVSSWTITTAGATSPTGITLDPANVSNLWIVDSGTDSVYQYNAAASLANGSSKTADVTFVLAAGNTNPQGIADPPAPGNLLPTEAKVLTEPVPAVVAFRGNDTALEEMYYEPLKKVFSASHARGWVAGVESASPQPNTDVTRGISANRRRTEVDDLFAEWDSDRLDLLSLPE